MRCKFLQTTTQTQKKRKENTLSILKHVFWQKPNSLRSHSEYGLEDGWRPREEENVGSSLPVLLQRQEEPVRSWQAYQVDLRRLRLRLCLRLRQKEVESDLIIKVKYKRVMMILYGYIYI